jgi:hypothetical protein
MTLYYWGLNMCMNLTHEEYFRMYGTLTEQRISDLLDEASAAPNVEGATIHINEGMAQFPAEDFLEPIKTRLIELQQNVRGANKDTLQGIIEALDDLAQITFYAADAGRDELQKALNDLS